jgi:lysophospholipid hydrolase
LRSRFDSGPSGQLGEGETDGSEADESSDYLGHPLATDHHRSSLPRNMGVKTPKATTRTLPPLEISESSLGPEGSDFVSRTPGIGIRTNNRSYVNPGDLHSMAGAVSDTSRPSRVYSILHEGSSKHGDSRRRSLSATRSSVAGLGVGDFDLREEVMSCIAKSIGLIQPPHLGHGEIESETAERSPGIPPFSSSSSDAGGGPSTNMFNSSFGSLSMLEVGIGVGDDASSTSASATGLASRPLLGFDNEVEILSFDAGSTLVMAGERNAGLCYFPQTFLVSPSVIRIVLCYRWFAGCIDAFGRTGQGQR